MSDRSRRDIERFNYAVYNRTGEKTPYNQIRETSRDSDESSDDNVSNISESGSENSSDSLVQTNCSYIKEARLDYLNRDLEIATFSSEYLISPNTKMSTVDANTQKLFGAHEALHDDINDFIDENPMEQLLNISDIDMFITRLEELRSKYRNIHKEVCNFISNDHEENLKHDFDKMLITIKEKISTAKSIKTNMRSNELNEVAQERYEKEKRREMERSCTESSIAFLFQNIDRLFVSIKKEISLKNISADRNIVDDDELIEMRRRLPALQQRIDSVSERVKELVRHISNPNDAMNSRLGAVDSAYEMILKDHVIYEESLKEEIRVRELNKQKRFQTTSLKVNVPKFKGYESPLDFYTFKDKFLQLYSQDVPVRALPELLKNNYLEGSALESVKRLQSIEDIWENLQKAFGDPRVMLLKKLGELDSVGSLGKIRDAEKTKDGLNKVVNIMQDLMRLAADHQIEEKLYYGDGIYSIYRIIGDAKVTKFIEKSCEMKLDGVYLWQELLKFLEKDIKVQLEKSMIYRTIPEKNYPAKDDRRREDQKNGKAHYTSDSNNNDSSNASHSSKDVKGKDEKLCHLCDKNDHIATKGPYGKKLIQYFSCKEFVEASCTERFSRLMKKGFCTQCLYPGASASSGKHMEGKCQNIYICKHDSHNAFTMKKHVLVCEEHKDLDANKTLLEEYRARCINRKCNSDLPDYAKTIQLSHHCAFTSQGTLDGNKDIGRGIYMFQKIKVDNETYNIFFDNGCGESVMTYDAVVRLGKNAVKTRDGKVSLGGVGGEIVVESPHGECQVTLPLYNGKSAVLGGLVIDRITHEFPTYTLNTKVEHDIHEAYKKSSGDITKLPRLPRNVGGQVDIMIGVQYLRYFPVEVFRTSSGLTLYLSPFLNIDGSRGVVAGPHPEFCAADNQFYAQTHTSNAFFTSQMQLVRNHNLRDQFSVEFCKEQIITHEIDERQSAHDYIECTCFHLSRNRHLFNEVENAGSEIGFRCPSCRNCKDCKSGEKIEIISIREEVEQEIINKSVVVDLESGTTTAILPFIEDPVRHLKPNREVALQVYNSQLRKLVKDPDAKADVIASEKQLQQLGFVEFVKNLTDDQRKQVFSAALQYFIPWRTVWNLNSVSTICRLVFDASMPTKSGKSLNDVLAKGRNQMNKLVEIVIRWFTKRVGFHTDVKKMYNSVKLSEKDWCYQMYLWQDELDPQKEPLEKIFKTLIYGGKPSGNQAERGLRETARLQMNKYPRACQVATTDGYVDDFVSGEDGIDQAYQTADELAIVLRNGGYHLKGFTFSGKPPPEHLSRDGESVNVVGMKWYPEEDTIKLDIPELNFGTKLRGKKPLNVEAKRVPPILTRKHCHAKVAEIFDIVGKITPITAGMKLDLHDFIDRGIQWKDTIPDDLRPVWLSHFDMMQEMSSLRYHRTVIPQDAVSLDIETIDTGDASKAIACIAIYARVKRRCGEYSCQLVFARSKLIEKGTTQPRAELIAAMLNAHTGEVVKRAFGSYHVGAIKVSDSQIVLHWINNEQKALKQYVRSRVIEILRFTIRDQWFYVESSLLIADLGTRKGATIKDVNWDSCWINGFEWMREDQSTFPIIPVSELAMSISERDSFKKELFMPYQREKDFDWPQVHVCEPGSMVFLSNRFNHGEIKARYELSQYFIDPNKYHFSTAVRVYAYVQRFVQNCKRRIITKHLCPSYHDSLVLTDTEISDAREYFFRKATNEVIHFAREAEYSNISTMKNGVLYYTGRVLPTQKINNTVTLTDVMKDLSSATFFVPIVDAYSPIAFSVINEVHWQHKVAKHRGVETVYRYVLQICFILNCRSLVKMFRKNCERCRYLAKRTIEIEMGPVSGQNLTIAPAFYITQVDIAGPFLSYSPYNKRTTVKIYYAVFCCSTTSSVNIKVMEDFGAPSFMQSFIRFSCEVGYPKILVSDEGSQLLKGYDEMRIDFTDLRNKLHHQVSVEFDIVPVGGHNMTGKVERIIKEVKSSIERSYNNQKLSILQWESVGAEICNAINDMPLALGNFVSEFEEMDLLTPNRLRMGRNNNRSPVGPLFVTNDPSKFFVENTKIFNAWFETWLTSHVPKLMSQPKWFRTEYHIQEGDIVLFLKKEGLLNSTYQYGMVKSVEIGRDGKIRKVLLKYRNHNESVDRETHRAVRQLIVIHQVDELNIIQELGNIATAADRKNMLSSCN